MNLFLAVRAEHKQRTGRDIFTDNPLLARVINCDVCVFLSAERRRLDRVEQEYYESLERDAKAEEPPKPA